MLRICYTLCKAFALTCSSNLGLDTLRRLDIVLRQAPTRAFAARNMPAQRAEQSQFPVDVSIATEPNNIGEVPTLLGEITKAFDIFANSNAGRKDLVVKCRALVQALETPRETMINHCWAQVSTS